MKKLIVIMTVALATIVANAAATKWNVSALKIAGTDGTGTYTSGSKAVIMASLSGSSAAAFEVAQVSISAGKITTTDSNFESSLLIAGNDYDFYFTITDGDKLFTSNKLTNKGAQESDTVTLSFGNQATAGSTWGPASVPEPTSGILFLIGIAGLALKRKCM